MTKQVHVFIKGDVIGVGFRAWTKIQAKKFGVRGWVRNMGQEVETVFQADEQTLHKIMAVVRQGPPISRVDDVEILWEEPQQTYNSFDILR